MHKIEGKNCFSNGKDLAFQLKQICDENGKEKDPEKSIPIFCQLARLYYQKTFDVFSLIRSAGLYNAAILRSPDDSSSIKDELRLLCSDVLHQANAKETKANLLEIANLIKLKIHDLRKQVDKKLIETQLMQRDDNVKETNKIQDIRNLQNYVSEQYTKIMADVAQQCQCIMGEPPCKFALVGMGSLARNEITPYSDFENVIVLEENKSFELFLDYFRWFSVIFQIIIINLQETILPSIAIFNLNNDQSSLGDWFYDDFTTRGICLDGMMTHACKFPLGRQELTKKKKHKTELIKPVSEMLKYLTSEEDLKNGYHLSDILTKVCFVFGDKKIFNDFQTKTYELLEKQHLDSKVDDIKTQLDADLKSFAIRTSLVKIKTSNMVNIKQTLYRSITLFISALGKYFNIRASSCFDIIEQLDEKEFSELSKHKLKYAVAVACEIRLRWYMKCKRQNDVIKTDQTYQNVVSQLQELVGTPSLISYFQNAYALQCDISNRFDLKRLNFYKNPKELNSTLYYCFGDMKKLSQCMGSMGRKNIVRSKKLSTFEEAISMVETDLNQINANANQSDHPMAYALESIARDFYQQGKIYSELRFQEVALECFTKYFDLLKQSSDAKYASLSCFMFDLITNQIQPERFEAVVETIQNRLQKKETESMSDMTDDYFTKSMLSAALSIVYLENHQFALDVLQAIRMCFEKSFLKVTDTDLAICHGRIGRCLMELNLLDDAMRYFKQSLKILESKSKDLNFDTEASLILNYIGRCQIKKGRHTEALVHFHRSLDILTQSSVDVMYDKKVAHVLSHLGQCLMDMNRPVEAMAKLKLSLEIRKAGSPDPQHDNRVAFSLSKIGCCLMGMNRFDDAELYLSDSLRIWKSITTDLNSDVNIAKAYTNLASCLKNLDRLDESDFYFQKSCRIKGKERKERLQKVND